METTEAIDAAGTAMTARGILKSIRENRIEVLLVIMLAHLLGLSDKIIQQTSGICL